MARIREYLVEVFWSDADEGYIAIAPDLPGCSAFGETPDEAVHEIQDAMLSWLEACAKMGRPLPEPLTKPQRAVA
ncbi:MAG: type II toxin-antitoxin system HicB family antitoxin [Gammaproteobacteria bacterium]